MQVRKHFYFSGTVQGVGFRYHAHNLARENGLTGWVRNLPDGRVEMEAQGELSSLRRLLLRLKAQRFVRVEHIETEDLPIQPEERGFEVLGWY